MGMDRGGMIPPGLYVLRLEGPRQLIPAQAEA